MSSPAIALVTGAAGGIGREIAAALHGDGWTVATTDLPGQVGPPEADFSVPADLRDRDECRRVLEGVLNKFGRLDLLVNNAATMTVVEPAVDSMDLWWQDLDVNLSAPLWLIQSATESLRKTRGQVVNITSISGLQGEAGFSAYAASKAGLLGMTRSLARELAPEIRVNAIAPGPTDTEQLSRDAAFNRMSMAQLHRIYTAGMPIGRLIRPSEVAELVVYLASCQAMTGECVQINGGMLMA